MGLYQRPPVPHALSVTQALLDLINDTLNRGDFPKPLAAAMSATASDASLRLSRLVDVYGCFFSVDLKKAIESAQIDFGELSQLTDLVIDHDLTARNAEHVPQAVHVTILKLMDRLKHIEKSIDGLAFVRQANGGVAFSP
jgi:hypothetical protein